jgi:hypothetical protein
MNPENNLYIYVVDRDFGFAPNPFHGWCTLATCKPKIRKVAQVGDWVMGVGGVRLRATGRCIYLMNITEILTFETYWADHRFQVKKPFRNGSDLMMVGDNIYHKDVETDEWTQEDSHHSKPDGTPNKENLKTDTSSENVLISTNFYYFGRAAPQVDLQYIGYNNGRGYGKRPLKDATVARFLNMIIEKNRNSRSLIVDYPFNFEHAAKRVDQSTGKIL